MRPQRWTFLNGPPVSVRSRLTNPDSRLQSQKVCMRDGSGPSESVEYFFSLEFTTLEAIQTKIQNIQTHPIRLLRPLIRHLQFKYTKRGRLLGRVLFFPTTKFDIASPKTSE